MYQTVNKFRKGYQPKSNVIEDKGGRLVINPCQRTEIWKECFDELLNTEDMDEINEPTTEKVKEVMKKLKKQ